MRFICSHRRAQRALLFVVLCASPAWAQEIAPRAGLPAEQKKLGDFLFAAFKHSRERLRSGVFEATEVYEVTLPDGRLRKRTVAIFCAFDYENGLMRYDREVQTRGYGASTKYFRTPRQGALFTPDNKLLLLAESGEEARALAEEHRIAPLDPRIVGFTGLAELKAGWTLERLSTFYQSKAQLEGAVKDANGQYRITLSHKLGSVSRLELHVWLDPANAHVPVRYDDRYFLPATKTWSATNATSTTTWAQMGGAWVPKMVTATRGGRAPEKLTLRLSWKSVNEPLPASLFNRNTFHLKEGTAVISTALGAGKPVVVEKIGPQAGKQPGDLPEPATWRVVVLSISGVVVIVALALLTWIKRRKARLRL